MMMDEVKPEEPRAQIKVPAMCGFHQRRLVKKSEITVEGPWRALLLASQVALFQGATATKSIQVKCKGDVTALGDFRCLGCALPLKFNAILQLAGRSTAIRDIKALGDRWVGIGVKKEDEGGFNLD